MDIKKTSKGWSFEPVTKSEEITLNKLVEFISEIKQPDQNVTSQGISPTNAQYQATSDQQTVSSNK